MLGVGCGSRTGLAPSTLELAEGGSMAGGGAASMSIGGYNGLAGVPSVAGRGGNSSIGGVASGGKNAGGLAGMTSGGVGIGGAVGVAGEPNAGAPSAGEGGSAGDTSTPRAVQLGLGAFHSCAVLGDRSLRCWGTGRFLGTGNLDTIGDDETPASIGPVPIGGRVLQVVAGWYHSCALLSTGRVRCFGQSPDGQLGYANTETIGDDELAESAGNVAVGGVVRQLAAGAIHTCAVLRSGGVRCWGDNERYQLGYTTQPAVGDDENPSVVGDVDVGGRAAQVAAGFAHSCALLESGSVRCWGRNIGGAVGYPGVNVVGDDETPASMGDIDVGGKVTQIVVGALHTCALLEGGRVRCWGAPTNGVLGYGNGYVPVGDDETPASAGDVDVGGKVLQLAAGDYATCALLEGGSVRCWGAGQLGQMGRGNTEDIGDDETPASAGDIDIGGVATSVDVGFLHVCVTLDTGAVRCWGRGATAALGYGNLLDVGDDETPASVGDVPLF